MKKWIAMMCLVLLMATNAGLAIADSGAVGNQQVSGEDSDFGRDGPAPNSGDGVSDGSGFDPTGDDPSDGRGPAPNSGDGVSDGSGF